LGRVDDEQNVFLVEGSFLRLSFHFEVHRKLQVAALGGNPGNLVVFGAVGQPRASSPSIRKATKVVPTIFLEVKWRRIRLTHGSIWNTNGLLHNLSYSVFDFPIRHELFLVFSELVENGKVLFFLQKAVEQLLPVLGMTMPLLLKRAVTSCFASAIPAFVLAVLNSFSGCTLFVYPFAVLATPWP
jgi:hypothetical protein